MMHDGIWRSLDSASALGAEGRRFESCYPDTDKPRHGDDHSPVSGADYVLVDQAEGSATVNAGPSAGLLLSL